MGGLSQSSRLPRSDRCPPRNTCRRRGRSPAESWQRKSAQRVQRVDALFRCDRPNRCHSVLLPLCSREDLTKNIGLKRKYANKLATGPSRPAGRTRCPGVDGAAKFGGRARALFRNGWFSAFFNGPGVGVRNSSTNPVLSLWIVPGKVLLRSGGHGSVWICAGRVPGGASARSLPTEADRIGAPQVRNDGCRGWRRDEINSRRDIRVGRGAKPRQIS